MWERGAQRRRQQQTWHGCPGYMTSGLCFPGLRCKFFLVLLLVLSMDESAVFARSACFGASLLSLGPWLAEVAYLIHWSGAGAIRAPMGGASGARKRRGRSGGVLRLAAWVPSLLLGMGALVGIVPFGTTIVTCDVLKIFSILCCTLGVCFGLGLLA